MPKIDWTKPIELEDGTPLLVEIRSDGVCMVTRADDEMFPDGWPVGNFDVDGNALCNEEYAIRNVRHPEPETPTEGENATDTITIRDRFAMAALNGMLAHPKRYQPRISASSNWHEAIAEEAGQIADVMMEARKK